MKLFISSIALFSSLLVAQAPDNTEKNKRDRDGKTVTPGDQSNSPADRDMLQKIRKAIVADKSLSTYAQNAKVMVVAGKVTLRGPVQSTEEKQKLETLATEVAGAGNVTNKLEISKGDK